MTNIIQLIVIFGTLTYIECQEISENDYKKLPPIYQMEDYGACEKEKNRYCKVKLILKPNDSGEDNYLWNIIQESKKDPYHLAHDLLYRGLCIPNDVYENKSELTRRILITENAKIENTSFSVSLDYIKCRELNPKPNLYDYTILCILISYIVLMIYATKIDASSKGTSNKFLMSLSISRNWEKVTRPIIENPDYAKLRSFEGIRTYNMCLVIIAHAMLGICNSFDSNMNIRREMFSNFFTKWLLLLAGFLVQTNFMFSAWLLSTYMNNLAEKRKKITLTDIMKTLMFRYFRLVPVLAVEVIVLEKTSLSRMYFTSPNSEFMANDYEACKKNWWATLLFINNIFYTKDMCNFGTWYLTNEFQLFVISLLMYYIMYKLDLKKVHVFGFLFAVPWLLNGYRIFNNNLDPCFRFTNENAKIENLTTSYSTNTLYFSIFASMGSFVVGLIFGNIYFAYKNDKIKFNWVIIVLWILGFFGISSLMVLISEYQYSPIISAIFGPLIKPLFALGIAIGVLGMSLGIEGPIKKVCEWKFAVFISKWSYSTFIVHFPIMMLRLGLRRSILVGSLPEFLEIFVVDIIISFLLGLLIHITIELPINNILNLILTGVKKEDKQKSS